MRSYLLFFICFAIASFSQNSQNSNYIYKNLVPNGSFENYRKKSNDIRRAIPWRGIETIDYYQNPLSNDTTAQKGAYSGYCYTGFRFRKKYKEFLQTRLAESLHRGTVYEFTMHIRLAFWSNAELRSFGVLFSKGGYRQQNDAIRSNMLDTVCLKRGLNNAHQWITIRGFYKADGGEKFITIGNFAPKIKKELVRIDISRFGPREAYYFVDDISLVKAPQFEEKIATQIVGPTYNYTEDDSTLKVKANIDVGEKIVLNNIFFEKGRYYLLPESFVELNKLAKYLIINPKIEIRINGHSDNIGMAHKNQKISELRAREVFEYLIKKGVQNKMYFKGFGGSQPIDDNTTDIGRAKNRRVEFEIIKN